VYSFAVGAQGDVQERSNGGDVRQDGMVLGYDGSGHNADWRTEALGRNVAGGLTGVRVIGHRAKCQSTLQFVWKLGASAVWIPHLREKRARLPEFPARASGNDRVAPFFKEKAHEVRETTKPPQEIGGVGHQESQHGQ